jgi:hypothetical protein
MQGLRPAPRSAINLSWENGVSMKRIGLIAVAALAPLAALAATVSTTTVLLGRVPALPRDAASAYGQWSDNRGDLTAGPAYAGLEADIRATAMAPLAHQQAAVNGILQKYQTPAGQAELKAMTLEQKMALAQQMQQAQMANSGIGATAVSDSDGALLRKLQMNPAMIQIRQKMADIAGRMGQIDQQWSAEDSKLAQAEQAEMAKLPICKSEAGEPSQLAIKGVLFAFSDKHGAVAAGFLPKYQALANEKRALVSQETKYADDSLLTWQHLANPMLRNQMQPLVVGNVANAANDVGAVLLIVETGSKHAAQTMARRKSLEAQYKDAKGC